MSTVQEIETAIERLPAEERWGLLHRFSDRMWDDWDAQIDSDHRAGRLDSLIAEVREDIAAGRAKPMHEVLRDE